MMWDWSGQNGCFPAATVSVLHHQRSMFSSCALSLTGQWSNLELERYSQKWTRAKSVVLYHVDRLIPIRSMTWLRLGPTAVSAMKCVPWCIWCYIARHFNPQICLTLPTHTCCANSRINRHVCRLSTCTCIAMFKITTRRDKPPSLITIRLDQLRKCTSHGLVHNGLAVVQNQ